LKHFTLVFVVITLVWACSDSPTVFSEKALNDTLLNVSDGEVTWGNVLKQIDGKKTVIDFWATWCRDCLQGFEELNELKQQFPDANYVYISLDRNTEAWKWGITKYQLKGFHFFLKNGKEGGLGDFLNLDWIPRYVVLDENNKILIFKAIRAKDYNIKNVLK